MLSLYVLIAPPPPELSHYAQAILMRNPCDKTAVELTIWVICSLYQQTHTEKKWHVNHFSQTHPNVFTLWGTTRKKLHLCYNYENIFQNDLGL